ncbi:hypothetical protein [Streptosporangium roseum]|uniref:hypothetical protein n=1 Tax=Streptosporangium roseum TaxID=2001 RepID=UPI0033297FA5
MPAGSTYRTRGGKVAPKSRERGRHGGRPKVVGDDMADYARALRTQGATVPQIARKLVTPSGKNKGEHPSVATAYRLLAEAEASDDTDE